MLQLCYTRCYARATSRYLYYDTVLTEAIIICYAAVSYYLSILLMSYVFVSYCLRLHAHKIKGFTNFAGTIDLLGLRSSFIGICVLIQVIIYRYSDPYRCDVCGMKKWLTYMHQNTWWYYNCVWCICINIFYLIRNTCPKNLEIMGVSGS